jgi:hypothetical protein
MWIPGIAQEILEVKVNVRANVRVNVRVNVNPSSIKSQ